MLTDRIAALRRHVIVGIAPSLNFVGRRKPSIVSLSDTDPKFVRIGGVLPAVDCLAWDGRKFGGAVICFRWSKWEKL